MFTREDLLHRSPTLWRYREALGIEDSRNIVSLGEGFTPLLDARLHDSPVKVKLDYVSPTGSYKDRGSAVMLSKLKEWGVSRIVEDSSGNAGASIAAYAALAGIKADIYIPASTSAGKAAQIAMHGANLIQVPGSREDTARAAWDAAEHTFYASHNWNPYFLAGMKTAAYEIAEQLLWEVPDWVIAPAGGGGLLVGLFLGFSELFEAGITKTIPRLAGVQAAGCDPIYRAWASDADDIAEVKKSATIAEGISVAKPVRGKAILHAIRASGGVVRTVGDDAIWDTVEALGRQGMYVEPTAAAAPAAFSRLRGDSTIRPADRVVIVLTGSGMKATDKIVERYASPVEVSA